MPESAADHNPCRNAGHGWEIRRAYVAARLGAKHGRRRGPGHNFPGSNGMLPGRRCPTGGGRGEPRCAAVAAALPSGVAGLPLRETTGRSTAAWGNPAGVVLRCGVPVPGPTTEQRATVNGIDWLVHENRRHDDADDIRANSGHRSGHEGRLLPCRCCTHRTRCRGGAYPGDTEMRGRRRHSPQPTGVNGSHLHPRAATGQSAARRRVRKLMCPVAGYLLWAVQFSAGRCTARPGSVIPARRGVRPAPPGWGLQDHCVLLYSIVIQWWFL